MTNFRTLSVLICIFILVNLDAEASGNKKLMSVNAAKADAQRCILESIIGVKVRSESVVRDMVAERFTIDSKTSGLVKDIEFTDIVYDPEKDIAKAVARIQLGSVVNVIGRKVNYKDTVIERVGFGTSTPENAAPLQALRAAQINAYQQLAERVVGLQIDSETTVENYILKSDDLKSTVLAAIWGAQVQSFEWDPQGDATVKMSLRANYVRDVMGQVFTSEHPEIIVEGMGSSIDSFSGSNRLGTSGSTEVREGTLGIPVEQEEKADELGGAIAP